MRQLLLSHVDGEDLVLLERKIRRSSGLSHVPGSVRKGMTVQFKESQEPMGWAIYHFDDELMKVEALQANADDHGILQLLISGLKNAASEKQIQTIWLITRACEAGRRKFLEECGFKLKVFCRADPDDERSPMLEYRKLD
ncbi:MAG: hypothetical protein ACXVB9_09625 [Bdellovibrionota bacterium]